MIDLRVLRDRWTEDGARAIFAELVTHCVRSAQPEAQAVRPDPGDEGLDTFVGEFAGDLRVFQAKCFLDRLSKSQKAQIRGSLVSCMNSDRFTRIVSWTLCLPIELSVEEHTWWQNWRKRVMKKYNCQVDLWAKSHFQAFSRNPSLKAVFDHALGRDGAYGSVDEVIAGMRGAAGPRPIQPLPSEDYHTTAIFVRKLELAGWLKHRAARTAFYNFELLRTAVEQGGNSFEQGALVDLRERVYGLWESAYNEHCPDRLGRALIAEVERRITAAHRGALQCVLPAGEMHKVGSVHDWADLCTAGWTSDYETAMLSDLP